MQARHSARLRRAALLSSVLATLGSVVATSAGAQEPIRIGVIAEAQAIAGASTPGGAQIAADEINAAGGINGRKIEIVSYDDHSSSAEAVRAFQRAVTQDRVSAVVASYLTEVVLALAPWADRLHMPTITPGAASDEITKIVHNDYDRNKYIFQGFFASGQQAVVLCDAAKELLVKRLGVTSAAIVSEDAAWTQPLDEGYAACLPAAGIKVVDHVRFAPDTTDFTPIFNKLEAQKPGVIMTGMAHVGVQPTVQWKTQEVPIPLFGISAQALSPTFWKDTNGATAGVMTVGFAVPDVAITPKTIPFATAYKSRFGRFPAYTGYMAYDDVYVIADAIRRAGATDPDKIVAAMEQTDLEGTIGRLQFNGRDDIYTHGLRYGPGYVTGLILQWQDQKQVVVWPDRIAQAPLSFPSFVKTGAAVR